MSTGKIRFHDIECTACGEHVIELTDIDAFDALIAHACMPGDFVVATAERAPDVAETLHLLLSRWKRHS